MERQRLQQQQAPWSPASSSGAAAQGTSSFKDAVFNAINVLLGVGVLSSPFSLRSSGWLIGGPLFVFFTLVTNHTAKLLGKCLDYQEGMTTETQLTIMAFLLIMPSMWTTHMSMLSYFSILGILSSFFCLYAIFFVGFATDTEAPGYVSGSLLDPQPVQVIGDLERIPLAIGLTMVAFGGHSVFPSICSSMANKEDYPRVLNVSYFIVGIVYGAIELAGYLMYGEATQKEITLNLIASYPGVLTQMVVWTIALNPMSKIAITLHPVALALEEFLLSPNQKRAAARNKPSKTLVFYRAFIRTTLGMGALCCAMFVPHFARVTSFLGAFFAMLVSVFLPCVCYLKLFSHRLSKGEIALNTGLAGLSIILMFFGTLASFLSPAD
ncbi:unnamed protein product [Phytophthora fragariaefolia]|uniref:Unnamed protein product n=1 Tax=Phytophthora fragariaefolia TaxID=1490495 RepID=A0A9W6X6Y9_9STRA|nr:unnamed protein product [Phytophthora fragariaefolia]